jgi:hypothetical protein
MPAKIKLLICVENDTELLNTVALLNRNSREREYYTGRVNHRSREINES